MTPDTHAHQCPKCGHVWAHDVGKHSCAKCGTTEKYGVRGEVLMALAMRNAESFDGHIYRNPNHLRSMKAAAEKQARGA